MSNRIEVCPTSELPDGTRRVVEVEGIEIGIFNVDGKYYAISNTCAHMQGPVCKGRVHGALEGTYQGPGKRIVERFSDDLAIACPWHGWEYDLETGVHLGDDSIRIPTYDVIVEDRTIYLEI